MGVKRKPRFDIGHKKGDLTVVAYRGHGLVNPDKPGATPMLHVQHFYRVRCSCGNEETVTQRMLAPHETKVECLECMQHTVHEILKGAKRKALEVGQFDRFLRMKLR